ncbi:uncharacterized protein LOC117293078 [Asterias rubens]|uniref:uncharacterized protein LOC117293078 n=1 Tax=Asterias rubens TaxID=7604 RepID=UPI0014555F76|nr:uncharacterized protein LOC117293078 [Asterias rubens]
MGDKMEPKKHNPLFIAMAILVCLLFVLTLIVNGLAGSIGITWGWFLNSTGDISDYYFLEITPAGWTFSIWGIIYTWQVLFVLYFMISMCVRNSQGPLYLSPVVITPLMLGTYALNLGLNTSWLFLWDRQLMPVALVVIALLPFTLWMALTINHRLVDQSGYELKHHHRGNLFAIRAIVQNGLAFYATWVTIATLLNFAIVLTYWANVDMSVACTVSLSILLVEVLIYSVLENIVLERYLRYTYGVWLVVIFALCGSLAQNWDATSRNSIYSVVLLGLAAVLFLLKIVLSIWRAFKRPLYVTDLSSSKEELALA